MVGRLNLPKLKRLRKEKPIIATVDKVKIGGTTYDMSLSGSGTLNTDSTRGTVYSSGDASSSTAWTAVDAATTSDTHATLFNKFTTMMKNIRYLYYKLGTTDFSAAGSDVSTALANLQNNKAASSHSHTTADLPVSAQQVDSASYIPTSSLVYSMQEEIDALNDAIDAIVYTIDDPNERTVSETAIATWNSASDVDTFLNRYNRANAYRVSVTDRLAAGNLITINDGTYNAQWYIAGFDLEYSQTAADGTVYNNGFGIMLVPKTQIGTGQWNTSNTTAGGYYGSYMRNTVLPGRKNSLATILGSHMVNRNVLLSNTAAAGTQSSYTWTTDYLTLMSIGQMTGTFSSNSNKYDDGEANYKLPVFNSLTKATGSTFWSRGVSHSGSTWYVNSDGSIYNYYAYYTNGVRPLLYLR